MRNLFKKWFGKPVKKKDVPRAKGIICIEKSIYPNDKPKMSRLGKDEWYGQ